MIVTRTAHWMRLTQVQAWFESIFCDPNEIWSSGVSHFWSMVVPKRTFFNEHFFFTNLSRRNNKITRHPPHLQDYSVDKLRHQESLWGDDLWIDGNPFTTTSTEHVSVKIDCEDSECTSRTTQRKWSVHSVEETAGPVPDILLEWDQILRGEHFFDDVNGGYLPFLRCEMKKLTWYTLWRCNMRLLQCKSAEMPAWNCWTWHRGCVQENSKRRSKVRCNELYQFLNCFVQCFLSKLWICLSQSWCRWVCWTGNHWSWDFITSAEHISTEQQKHLFTSNFPWRIVRRMTKTKMADWSRVCTELKTLPTSGNLTTWTWLVESLEASEEGNTVQHCSTIQFKTW